MSETLINANILKTDSLPGQSSVLQDSLSVLSPSHMPPFTSSTFFVLVFNLVPLPHVLEHSPICHSFHSQLIGARSFSTIQIKGTMILMKICALEKIGSTALLFMCMFGQFRYPCKSVKLQLRAVHLGCMYVDFQLRNTIYHSLGVLNSFPTHYKLLYTPVSQKLQIHLYKIFLPSSQVRMLPLY